MVFGTTPLDSRTLGPHNIVSRNYTSTLSCIQQYNNAIFYVHTADWELSKETGRYIIGRVIKYYSLGHRID